MNIKYGNDVYFGTEKAKGKKIKNIYTYIAVR